MRHRSVLSCSEFPSKFASAREFPPESSSQTTEPTASLGELRNQGTCVVADHRLRRCVGVEDAVPALRFVRRIADVAGVAPHEMVIGMLCPPFAAPAPEVAPLQRPAGADAVKHGAGDQSVEAVLQGRGGAGIEAPAIAGEAEFLDNERLAEPTRDSALPCEVGARVALDRWPRTGEILRVCPAPVLRPDMRRHVIDRRSAMRVDDALIIVIAALRPLASNRNQMISVE